MSLYYKLSAKLNHFVTTNSFEVDINIKPKISNEKKEAEDCIAHLKYSDILQKAPLESTWKCMSFIIREAKIVKNFSQAWIFLKYFSR